MKVKPFENEESKLCLNISSQHSKNPPIHSTIYLVGIPMQRDDKEFLKFEQLDVREKTEFLGKLICRIVEEINSRDLNTSLILIACREYLLEGKNGAPISCNEKNTIIDYLQSIIADYGQDKVILITGGIAYYNFFNENEGDYPKAKFKKISDNYRLISKKYPKLGDDLSFIVEKNHFDSMIHNYNHTVDKKYFTCPWVINNKIYVLDGRTIIGKHSKIGPYNEHNRFSNDQIHECFVYNPGRYYSPIVINNLELGLYSCYEINYPEIHTFNPEKIGIQLVLSDSVELLETHLRGHATLYVDSAHGTVFCINEFDFNLPSFIPVQLNLNFEKLQSAFAIDNQQEKQNTKYTICNQNNFNQLTNRYSLFSSRSGQENESTFSEEEKELFFKLMQTIKKEIRSCWPYPNKDRKRIEVKALNELLLSTNRSKKELSEHLFIKYPEITQGVLSHRIPDLLRRTGFYK